MGFLLLTLTDLEWPNGHHYVLFHTILSAQESSRPALCSTCFMWVSMLSLW